MDERRLTVIVVPHGDLETRTFEISYRKLRVLGWTALVVVGLLVMMVAFWFTIAAQAARVDTLEQELAQLERQRTDVDSLASLLAEVEGQYARVRELLGADGAAAGQEPALPDLRTRAVPQAAPTVDLWPLTVRGYVTQQLTPDVSHPGLDIAVPQSSHIRAAGSGTVVAAAEDSVYGRHIRIDHGGGIETLYGHASQLLVKQGQKVERGNYIALSGNTGRSTAPHLHFEVRRNGIAVDPLTFVRKP